MKINIDRLCKLAGVSSNQGRRSLNEASNRSMHDDNALSGESEWRFGKNQLAESDHEDLHEEEGADEGVEDDMGEVIEVDEAMLVQELRRAKKIMTESKRRRRQNARRSNLSEQRELKKIIEEEVDNVMADMNLTGGWVYGSKRPRNSRKGQVATSMPGIGFKSYKNS